MNYDIVTLEEKTVTGLEARTNNLSPDMGMVIGGLWKKFYEEGVYMQIPGKKTESTLGIYTDYAGNEKDDYTFLVACETDEGKDIPQGTVTRKLPAGRYARFTVTGDVQKDVGRFWQELWQMDLPRSFVCDFEEYTDSSMGQAKVNIYIGLKD